MCKTLDSRARSAARLRDVVGREVHWDQEIFPQHLAGVNGSKLFRHWCTSTEKSTPSVVFRYQAAIDQAPDSLAERWLVRLLGCPFLDLPALFRR